jgi:hypothetical protein
LCLAITEKECAIKLEAKCRFRESVTTHDGGATFGKVALARFNVRTKEVLAHDRTKHCIAEELQPLIID